MNENPKISAISSEIVETGLSPQDNQESPSARPDAKIPDHHRSSVSIREINEAIKVVRSTSYEIAKRTMREAEEAMGEAEKAGLHPDIISRFVDDEIDIRKSIKGCTGEILKVLEGGPLSKEIKYAIESTNLGIKLIDEIEEEMKNENLTLQELIDLGAKVSLYDHNYYSKESVIKLDVQQLKDCIDNHKNKRSDKIYKRFLAFTGEAEAISDLKVSSETLILLNKNKDRFLKEIFLM